MNRVLLILTLTLSFGFFNLPKTQGETVSAPIITSFESEKPNIGLDQSTILKWSVSGNPAPTLSIDNGVGVVTGSSVRIPVAKTTKYFLTAINSAGIAVSEGVTITVDPKFGLNPPTPTPTPTTSPITSSAPTIVSFFQHNSNGVNTQLTKGQSATLVFKVTGTPFPEIFIENGIGKVTASTSLLISPKETTTYTLIAKNSVGSESEQLTVTVVDNPDHKKLSILPSQPGETVSGLVSYTVSAPILTMTPEKIEYYIDGSLFFTGSNRFILNTLRLTNGIHELKIKAFDSRDNVIPSETIRFNVSNPSIERRWSEESKPPKWAAGVAILEFKDKMWLLGPSGNDVWSSEDGVRWNLVRENSPNDPNMWSPRYSHAVTVFDNKMWVMGGVSQDGKKNDVWFSEDGQNWSLSTANAAWSARYTHSAVTFNNQMWVMGGIGFEESNFGGTQGVWSSSDGVRWIQVVADPGWKAGNVFTSITFNGKMWVMGVTVSATSEPTPTGDKIQVWSSSDGINWARSTEARSSPLNMQTPHFSSYGTVVFDNKLWIMGGRDDSGSLDVNEVFSSAEGINWQREFIKDGWKSISLFGALIHKGAIWVLDGKAVWKLVSDSTLKPMTLESIKNQVNISKNVQKRAKLIKSKDSPRVYYVTEKGFKRWMPTEAVFLSYGNLWSDVVAVDQAEIDAKPDTILIREANDSKVYKLENGLKRWIISPEAFVRQGFSWDLIAPVNKVELNHYPVGENIN